MAFPNSPSINELYVDGNTVFIWDGDKWTTTPDTGANFAIGPAGPQGATGASYTGPVIEQSTCGAPTISGPQPGTLNNGSFFGGVTRTSDSTQSWTYTRIGDRVELTGYIEISSIGGSGSFGIKNGQFVLNFPRPIDGGPPLPHRNDNIPNSHGWSPVAYVYGDVLEENLFVPDNRLSASGVWSTVLNAADQDTIYGPIANTSDDKLSCILWMQDIKDEFSGGAPGGMVPFKIGYCNGGTILDFKITYYTARSFV